MFNQLISIPFISGIPYPYDNISLAKKNITASAYVVVDIKKYRNLYSGSWSLHKTFSNNKTSTMCQCYILIFGILTV